MIGKITRCMSFQQAVEYAFSKTGAEVVYTNISEAFNAEDNPKPLIAAFDHHAGLHDRTTKPVYKIAVSPAKGDRLTPLDWSNLCKDLMTHLGMIYHQTVAVLHRDTYYPNSDERRDHIHIIANAVSDEGECANFFLGLP